MACAVADSAMRQLQHFLKGRDSGAGEFGRGLDAGVQALDLCERHVAHLAGSIGAAIHRVVVAQHQLSVSGGSDIDLDEVRSQADGFLECRDSVLRVMKMFTPVRNRDDRAILRGELARPESQK
jgi:hypothetical protein